MKATVKEWIEKAEEDFHILERESRVRKNPPTTESVSTLSNVSKSS